MNSWGLPRFSARFVTCAVAALVMLAVPLAAHAQDKGEPAGIFKPLRVGQKVTLADKAAAGMEISLFNDGAIGSHSIVELAAGHIVLEDLAAVSRIWLPTTSIRSVVWLRLR